jgi:hypothetical protein
MIHSRSLAAGSLFVGAAGVVCLVVSACSSAFSDCEAARDCGNSAGSGGQAGAADGARAGSAGKTASLGDGGAADAAAGAAGDVNAGASNAGAAGEADNAGAGGKSETAANSESGGNGGAAPSDTIPPTILGITPINGATRLTTTTDSIVITFNEPMNRTATEAACVPSSAAPAPSFSWNALGTVLTINPNLSYPAATDPNAAATPFQFSISTAAKDLAGNSVTAQVAWQFTLLREITQSLGYTHGGNLTTGKTVVASFAEAGDTASDLETRGFMSYDISALPAGIVTLESATISTHIAGIYGDPFGLLGNMLIQSVSYTSINSTTFDQAPLHDLGTFIAATGNNASNDPVSKDVLPALGDDYANRAARNNSSQYRLLFSAAPNANGTADAAWVSSSAASNQLVVKYLYP